MHLRHGIYVGSETNTLTPFLNNNITAPARTRGEKPWMETFGISGLLRVPQLSLQVCECPGILDGRSACQ